MLYKLSRQVNPLQIVGIICRKSNTQKLDPVQDSWLAPSTAGTVLLHSPGNKENGITHIYVGQPRCLISKENDISRYCFEINPQCLEL